MLALLIVILDKLFMENFARRLFIIYLKLISNISSHIPERFRAEIFDIHFELLCNGNSEIQKYAVDYICKVKGMNLYKYAWSLKYTFEGFHLLIEFSYLGKD